MKMKKVVLLIETENSKFLVMKKNGWMLPILTINHNYNEKKLNEEIKNKYNLDVDSISKVEVYAKYVLLKCRLRSQYNKKIYKEDILKNIMDILTVKYQQRLIGDFVFKIHKELLNDAIWLGLLLSAKVEIENVYLKTIITDFILFNSTIFCDEVLNYGFGEIKDDSNITKNMIKELRNYYLKDFPTMTSKKTNKIFTSMGIDLNNYMFDINVYTYRGKIIDINSRTWMENYESDYELYNGMVLSPRNWIKNMFPNLEIEFEEVRKPFIDMFLKKFKTVNIKKNIYSSYKLLDRNLDDNSKIYILQRIGLLKTVMFISDMFFDKTYIASNETIEINFNKLLRKSKATIIEILGKEREKVPVLKKIIDSNPYELNESFFRLNRRCRNNLHYGFYNELSEEEIDILDKQQDIYLNYVIEEFEKRIKLKFDFLHYTLLGLAFLEKWSKSANPK